MFANLAGQADDDGDEAGGEGCKGAYDEGGMCVHGGAGVQQADGEVQVWGGGGHDVDLSEVVVESVNIGDKSIEDLES